MKNLIIIALIGLCGFFVWKWITKPEPDPTTVKIAQSGRDLVEADVENIAKKVRQDGITSALIDDEKQVVNGPGQVTDSTQKKLDSTTALLNIKEKQVIALTSIISRFEADRLKARNTGDSIFDYSDKYASITFNRPDETFSLKYDAEVNMAEYWKRDWFLAPRKRFVELWMSDPRATINGVSRLRFEPKQDNFGVKIKGIGDYNGKHHEVYLGGGVEVETKRFEYEGSYLYDFNSKRWYPGFKIGLKLLEF